jgi:hypothetical protein
MDPRPYGIEATEWRSDLGGIMMRISLKYDPEDNLPFQAWASQPADLRSEVVRLAQAGQPHSDPEVRVVAENWAHAVLSDRPWGLVGRALFVPAALVLTALFGTAVDPPGSSGPADRNSPRCRREARLILAAGRSPA